jgi:hypothetical protein
MKGPATLSGETFKTFVLHISQEMNSVDEDANFWDMALRD